MPVRRSSSVATLFLSVGLSVAASNASAAPITIDNFEDGNLVEYTLTAGTNFYSASTTAAHDGTYGLDAPNSSGPAWLYRTDSVAQVSQGDTLSAWLRPDSEGRLYFGFGASSLGALSLVLSSNTDQLLIQDNTGFNFLTVAGVNQTYVLGTWYRVEVDWASGGLIIGSLYGSDGVTLLNSVSATIAGPTSGGIALRGWVGAIDTIERLDDAAPVPEPASLTLLGLGLAGMAGRRWRQRKAS